MEDEIKKGSKGINIPLEPLHRHLLVKPLQSPRSFYPKATARSPMIREPKIPLFLAKYIFGEHGMDSLYAVYKLGYTQVHGQATKHVCMLILLKGGEGGFFQRDSRVAPPPWMISRKSQSTSTSMGCWQFRHLLAPLNNL